jgi:hypothetical protein
MLGRRPAAGGLRRAILAGKLISFPLLTMSCGISREVRASPPDPPSRSRAEALASLVLGPPEAFFFFLAATTALVSSRRKTVETSELNMALIKASSL